MQTSRRPPEYAGKFMKKAVKYKPKPRLRCVEPSAPANMALQTPAACNNAIMLEACRKKSGASAAVRGSAAAWAAACRLYSQLGEDNLMQVAFGSHVAR